MTTNRFVTPAKSEVDAINQAEDLAIQASNVNDVPYVAGSATLTMAQFLNGVIRASGQTGAVSLTTPTAAAIVAALKNCQVGSAFEVAILNANTSSGAITIVAGSGVTLLGTTAVPITKTQLYKGIVTNATAGAEAVSLIGLLTAPV